MGDTIKDNLTQKVDSRGQHSGEDVIDSLGDGVMAAILNHIVKTGGCTAQDLTNIKAVVEEAQSLIGNLENCGLIKIKGNTVEVIEKGRKFLEHLKEMEETLIQK